MILSFVHQSISHNSVKLFSCCLKSFKTRSWNVVRQRSDSLRSVCRLSTKSVLMSPKVQNMVGCVSGNHSVTFCITSILFWHIYTFFLSCCFPCSTDSPSNIVYLPHPLTILILVASPGDDSQPTVMLNCPGNQLMVGSLHSADPSRPSSSSHGCREAAATEPNQTDHLQKLYFPRTQRMFCLSCPRSGGRRSFSSVTLWGSPMEPCKTVVTWLQ